MKKALITGITGQDGSYLAEFLLDKGYEVHGILRRSSSFNTGRIEHLYMDDLVEDMHKSRNFQLHYGDLTDSTNVIALSINFINLSGPYLFTNSSGSFAPAIFKTFTLQPIADKISSPRIVAACPAPSESYPIIISEAYFFSNLP